MTVRSPISQLGTALLAFFLTVAPMSGAVRAVEDPHKVSVVSFGLFGDQSVFRSEATGAAQIVASRFGGGPAIVNFNTKTGGGATIEALAATLEDTAKQLHGQNDILFLILTSHGSPHGLAITAGPLAENTDAVQSCRDARPNGRATQGRDHFGLLFWRLHTCPRQC